MADNDDVHLLTADGFYQLTVILMAVCAAGALHASVRTPAARLRIPRWCWLLLPQVLVLTGDAAAGDGRPPVERAGKAVIAVLLWTSLAVVGWRRRQHRRGVAVAPEVVGATPVPGPAGDTAK